MDQEQRNKFDLDVINLVKDFTKDEQNAVLYITMQTEDFSIKNTLKHIKADEDTITALIFTLIQIPEIKTQILNAFLNYFKANKEEIQDFVIFLRQIQNGNR
jgi:hypothetical protein